MRNLLMGFPRTGTTWIRLFFENYTMQSSMGKKSLKYQTDKICIYRAHHFSDTNLKIKDEDRVVFMLRNPWDVIVSNMKWLSIEKKARYPFAHVRTIDYLYEIDCYTRFPGKKTVIYHEDLIEDFEKAIIPAIKTYGYPVDLKKIWKFSVENVANWKKVNVYFSENDPDNPTFNDMKYGSRRKKLTKKEIEVIDSILLLEEKEYWCYTGKLYGGLSEYEPDVYGRIIINADKVRPLIARYISKSIYTFNHCHFVSEIMPEEDIKMEMKKVLSDKGKERVFNAIKEYIDAKIDLRTLCVRTGLNQEQVEKRAAKAEEELKAVIFYLEWRHK